MVPAFLPVSEQTAIATTLSDADALLNGLDRLIAKKRAIKTAAMQQLLTGQTRLPGFGGEWEQKRLGQLADVDPENLSSSSNPEYEFKYISLEDVNRGTLTGFSEQVLLTAPSRARRKLRKNDVLVSTVRPNLQSHLLFGSGSDDWVCSNGFSVVRCRQEQANLVFNQIFGHSITLQIDALITGSNYPAINSGDVRKLLISVPPTISEQTAIATILTDMDAEITALETSYAKTQSLKQGMIQELLTGRTRLL